MDTVENLILDLLEWVSTKTRTYEEVMDAWRTSCPRLPVWEDATDQELLRVEQMDGDACVRLTDRGFARLRACRPSGAAERDLIRLGNGQDFEHSKIVVVGSSDEGDLGLDSGCR